MSDPRVTRERLARALLTPLFLISLYGALFAPWHAASSLDSRTQIEMIRGISEHGLPYMTNGPVDQFPELQVAWNVIRSGRSWGTYPPVFSYLATPFFMLGGLRAVCGMSMALISLLAIGAFALGARYTKDPLLGTATAYVTLGTCAASSTLDIGPYMLTVTLITWSAYFAVAAIDESGSRAQKLAACAGITGGLAAGAHLLTLPMLAGLLFVLFALPAEGWKPTRESLVRGSWALAGAALPLDAMAFLNRVRFGSWNPASYGPCPWRRCEETGLGHQSLGSMISYAVPVLAWALGIAVFIALVRRSRVLVVVVGALGIAALIPQSPLRQHASRLFVMIWGYVVDVSDIPMAPMVPAGEGPGTFWGRWVVKSTLQGAPALLLALLAPSTTRRDKLLKITLLLPCAGIYALLALRANLPAVHALGFPLLYLRYVMPALPLLAALSVGAVRELPWRRVDLLVLALIAIGFCGWLATSSNDFSLLRRLLILRATLVIGLLAAVSLVIARRRQALVWKRAATLTAAAAFAIGPAITVGIDLPATYGLRDYDDDRLDTVARQTPKRFALVGYSGTIDIPLTLRATRDVECADLSEATSWANFRTLVDVWAKSDRPVYAMWPREDVGIRVSPWPDILFETVDADAKLVRIRKKP